MAVPVFRAATAKSAATTGTNAPGLPAGLAAGDIVFLVATVNTGATISITTAGSLTWNVLGASPFDVALGEKLYVWWGRYVSGATGPTLSAASDTDHSLAATIAYSGCVEAGSPIDTTGIAASAETTSDTSFSFATGVASTAHNAMCVCIATSGVDSNTGQVPVMTNAALGTLTSRMNFETTSGGGGGFGWTEGTLAAGGSMGTFACTYSGASPKAYVAFALRGGKSGVTATTVTDTIGSAGVTTKLAATASTITDTIATAGVRTRFGVTATTETLTIAAAGNVTAGAIMGATDTAITFSASSSGVRTSLGATSSSYTFTPASAGVVRVDGASASSMTFSAASAAVVTRFGAVATSETFQIAAAGVTSISGAAALDVAVTMSTVGIANRFAASAFPLTVTSAATGTRTTFATSTFENAFAAATAGTRETFSTVSFDEVLDIFVASGGAYGVASFTLALTVQTDAVRQTFAAVTLGETLAITAAGNRTTSGTSLFPLVMAVSTSGFIPGFVYPAGAAGSLEHELQGIIALTRRGDLARDGEGGLETVRTGSLSRPEAGVLA